MAIESCTLAGGCFWCLESVFKMADGVQSVVSGYAGGHTDNPSYEMVCSGRTGHAEVVQISFDPQQIGFAQLLEIFFTIHDPTTLNRQGADVGTQYRSAIFYHDEAQKNTAIEMISRLGESGVWRDPIVTEVVPLVNYSAAEAYHQNFFESNPGNRYCQLVAAPKMVKFREKHPDLLKK